MREVYWWREGCEGHPSGLSNFGDELNALLLQLAEVKQFEWAPAADCDFVIAGSVLEHLPAEWTGTVCGAGLLHEDSQIDLSKATVLGLRGKLTLQRVKGLAKPEDVVLGDPALLVPAWIRQYQAKWDVGIIPHWTDTELFKRYPYGHLIDVRKPPLEVVADAAKCKRIISSSLHGIIVADAYGIPRQAELFPNAIAHPEHEGGDFKWRDYASIYDTHPHFGEMWTAPYEKVAKIQHDLRIMMAGAMGTPPPPVEQAPERHRRRCCPCRHHRRHRPQASLLVPYRDDHEHRAKVWQWLKAYWREHLDSIEIIEGRDEHYPFCADAQTQILTASGWKSYGDLRIGEAVLTLNHKTSFSEWQHIEAVNVFDVVNEPMLSSEGWAHSSLTTMNHRWPVVRRSGKGIRKPRAGSRGGRGWATSGTLTSGDCVPISAQHAEFPIEAKYTDAFVEVVAWAWTEGTYLKTSQSTQAILISQSRIVNPSNCDRIRAALTSLAGPPVERLSRRWPSSVSQWREYDESNNNRFYIGSNIGEVIRSAAPDRVPSFDFLLSLTRAQLSLFIEVSMMADGTSGTTGSSLAQKNPQAAEAFQFACILAGHATSIRKTVMPAAKRAKYGYDMTNVHLRTARSVALTSQKICETTSYTGKVWCPTTANGTWLARRNGSVYFTGNSKAAAVNDAASRARGRIFMIVDADAYLDSRFIQRYINNMDAAVKAGKRQWYIPYNKLYRLSRPATMALLDTDPEWDYPIHHPPQRKLLDDSPLNPHDHNSVNYGHKYGALIQMMPREAFFMVGGMDPRFRGWGSEDVSFLHAVDTIYCQHQLGDNDAIHLWHARPGISWDTRRWIGQPDVVANSRLAQRYTMAISEPGFMQALADEYPPPRDVLEPWWKRT